MASLVGLYHLIAAAGSVIRRLCFHAMGKALTIVAERLREEAPLNGAGARISPIQQSLTARQAYNRRCPIETHQLDKEV